jgi:beta-lactamase class A
MRLLLALAAGLTLTIASMACVAVELEPLTTPTPVPATRATPPAGGRASPPPALSGTATGRMPAQASAPTAEPSRPATFITDQVLQRQLEALLDDAGDRYGVYVKHLESGRGAAVNPDRVFNAASMFKVEVMYEVFRQRSLGLLRFDEMLEVTPYYQGFDLGTLPVEVGQSLSIAEALRYMMSVSDNVSAVLLQDRVGAGNVNATMRSLGLKESGLFTEGLPITAGDFGILFEAIATGREVDEETRNEMLDLLASERISNGLTAGAPVGTRIAHKTGNWSDATHDGGIVFGPSGAYILVVLSETSHDPSGIRAVAALVYDYFNKAGR